MRLEDVRVGQVVRCHGAFDMLEAPDGEGRVVHLHHPSLGYDSVMVELHLLASMPDERPPLNDAGEVMVFVYQSEYLELMEDVPVVSTPNLRMADIVANQSNREESRREREIIMDRLDRATNEVRQQMNEFGQVTREINGVPETEFKERHGIRKLPRGPAIGRGKRRLGI